MDFIKLLLKTLLVIFILAVGILTVRPFSVVFGLVILLLWSIIGLVGHGVLFAGLIILLVASGFSPIEITLQNLEGSPRVISYCNIRQPAGDLALQVKRGECYIASDIVGPFESSGKFVW